jgi:Holliday junction resolvase RusA-like endonuclease
MATIAKNALQRAKSSILEGSLRYSVWFYGLRANSDLDNGIKMMDAFNGVLWVDDRQICEIHAYRMPKDGNDRTEITVELIDSD